MDFLYALINFLILAAILFLLFGKSMRNKFASRRERINAELDEAEALERGTPAPESVSETHGTIFFT